MERGGARNWIMSKDWLRLKNERWIDLAGTKICGRMKMDISEINKRFKKITFKEFGFNFLILILLIWGPAFLVYRFWGGDPAQILTTHLLNMALIFCFFYFWFFEKYNLHWNDLGFSSGKFPVWVDVLIGIFAAVLFLGVINLTFPVIYFHDFGAYSHDFKKMSFGIDKLIALKLLILPRIFLAPLFEETVFRGILYQYLRSRLGRTAVALVLQAVIFVLLHFSFYPLTFDIFLALFLKGLFLGMVFQFTESLPASISCHAMFNFFATIM